jgi:hypothetical protein
MKLSLGMMGAVTDRQKQMWNKIAAELIPGNVTASFSASTLADT